MNSMDKILNLAPMAVTLSSPVPWRPQFEVYLGYPLKDVDTEGGDLQDMGLHFQFLIAAF